MISGNTFNNTANPKNFFRHINFADATVVIAAVMYAIKISLEESENKIKAKNNAVTGPDNFKTPEPRLLLVFLNQKTASDVKNTTTTGNINV